nr:DoxX family protein [Mycobacterium basiliense]
MGAQGSPAAICIRLMVGLVFLSEGIQKFLFPHQLGPGRFERIGIPAATFLANLDGVIEIVCGTLIVVGMVTRAAAIPLLIDIVGAIVLTKLPELQPGGFLGVEGFWGMAHDARTDLSMLLGLAFLLWSGPGRWSVDARLATECPSPPEHRKPPAGTSARRTR